MKVVKIQTIIPALVLAGVVGGVERAGKGAIDSKTIDELQSTEESKALSMETQQEIMDRYCETPTLENAARILSFPVSNENLTYRMGYYSQLYRQHASRRDALVAAAGLAPGYAARLARCAAEWLSGDAVCVDDALLQLEYDPIMKSALRIGKNTPRPDFARLEDLEAGIEETQLLDMAWGAYDATRDSAILLSLIRCAARTAPPEKDAVRFWMNREDKRRLPMTPEMKQLDVVAMAAKWSVRSRAAHDAAFAARVQECLSSLPDAVQARFNEPLRPTPGNKSNYTPNPQ